MQKNAKSKQGEIKFQGDFACWDGGDVMVPTDMLLPYEARRGEARRDELGWGFGKKGVNVRFRIDVVLARL